MRSCTSSRLSTRWAMRASNPAAPLLDAPFARHVVDGHRGDGPDGDLVRRVAGVHDPRLVAEPPEHHAGVTGHRGGGGRHREAPRRRPQWSRRQRTVERGGGQVVVVGQRQVHIVRGEQRQCLGRLVFVNEQPDRRAAHRELRRDRQQRPPYGRREPGDPQRPGRLRVRVQVEPGRLDRGQDRHRVLGQPPPGRGQPDPPPVRFDQCRARLPGQHGQLLGHRRRGDVQLIGDVAHRSQPGQFEQQTQATDVHPAIVKQIRTVSPQLARGRERWRSGLLRS